MARDITTDVATASTAVQVEPVIFCYLDWPSAAVRLWTGTGPKTWDSQTWLGTGLMGAVSPIEESTDGSATGISLTLTGIPSDLVSTILNDDYQGRTATLWLGFLDSSGSVIADPVQIFSGKMDVASIDDEGETGTITLTVESELVDFLRSRERRYTHEDQQIDYPGDLGFEFVSGLQDKSVSWGKASPAPAVDMPEGGGPSSGNSYDYFNRG